MDGTKPWYQSKNIWTCVVTGLIGIYMSLPTAGVHVPPIPPWILTLLGAIGVYTRATADTKIG